MKRAYYSNNEPADCTYVDISYHVPFRSIPNEPGYYSEAHIGISDPTDTTNFPFKPTQWSYYWSQYTHFEVLSSTIDLYFQPLDPTTVGDVYVPPVPYVGAVRPCTYTGYSLLDASDFLESPYTKHVYVGTGYGATPQTLSNTMTVRDCLGNKPMDIASTSCQFSDTGPYDFPVSLPPLQFRFRWAIMIIYPYLDVEEPAPTVTVGARTTWRVKFFNRRNLPLVAP
ncbi:capsid protein [Capybara virus 13_cap1_257]|nr:capsid protein [Capybara virus 13_cap1_257]